MNVVRPPPAERPPARAIRSYARKLRRRSRTLIDGLRPRALVLCYHSITERDSDPHLIAVKPANFAEHIQVLLSRFHVTSLRDLVTQLRSKQVRRRAVALTLDDGYSDNLYAAKPILERRGVPATVFVATGAVGDPRVFWWEELIRLVLDGRSLPRSLSLSVGGAAFDWEAADRDGPGPTGCAGWNMMLRLEPTTDRARLYSGLFDFIQRRPPDQRQEALAQLRAAIGFECDAAPPNRPCTAEELGRLAADGLIELGAHTVTHPVLSALPAEDQLREMLESKRFLERITDRLVTSFAYPYGGRRAIGDAAPGLARGAGFENACSLTGRTVTARSDPYVLPRRPAPDVGGSEFESWLEGQFRR